MFLVCVVIPVIRNSNAGHACSASFCFQRIKRNLGWNGPLEIICSSFLLRAGELLIKIRLLRAVSRWVMKISKDRPCHPWRNCPHWEGYFFFISHWNIPCATCVHCLSVLAAAGSLPWWPVTPTGDAWGKHLSRFCPWGWNPHPQSWPSSLFSFFSFLKEMLLNIGACYWRHSGFSRINLLCDDLALCITFWHKYGYMGVFVYNFEAITANWSNNFLQNL